MSEGDNIDLFTLLIPLALEGTSEMEHEIVIHAIETDSTATLEPLFFRNIEFDAVFGVRESPEGPLEEVHVLNPGQTQIEPLRVNIRNDFIIEEEECFTLRAFIQEGSDFTCNDGTDATNFFCQTTICIEDDDGKLMLYCIL